MTPPEDVEIVVAGIPRSGTTMLYRAVAGLPPGPTTPKPQTGPVRKTHSFEPETWRGIRAAVFVFGDPIASVASTRAKRWDSGHFANCGAAERDPETTDIYREDALHYEAMFDAWMCRQPFDLVAVRYETMHEHAPMIEAVLGREIPLPDRRPRTDHVGELAPDDLAAIRRTYTRLVDKVHSAPDCAIWRAKHP